MKTTIKSVSKINAYGTVYHIIRYSSGKQKTIWYYDLPKTVYAFINNAPWKIIREDRKSGWKDETYTYTPNEY